MRVWGSAFMVRLLLLTLLIGIVPVMALGMFSFLKFSTTVQDKVNEGNMQILRQTQARMEQSLLTADYLANQFANSSLVNSSISLAVTRYDFDTVGELTKGIQSFQFMEYATNAFLINYTNNWMISFRGLESLSSAPEFERLKAYAGRTKSSEWFRDQLHGQDSLILIKKLPLLSNSTSPGAMLVFQFSAPALQRQLIDNGKLGDFMVISDSLAPVIEGRHFAFTELPDLPDEAFGQVETRMMDTNVLVMYRKSTYNGWIYVTIISLEDVIRESRTIGWVTLLVSIGVILVVVLAALLGTRKMYSPIGRLLQIVPKDKHANAGKGRDEFVAIESGLRSLMAQEEKLTDQMRMQVPYLRELFAMKLLLTPVNSAEMKQKLAQYGHPVDWSWLVIVSVQIDTLENTRFKESDRELLMFAINNMVSEIIPAENRLSPVVMDRYQITIVASRMESYADCKHEIDQIAHDIKGKLAHYLGLQTSVVISRPYVKLEQSCDGYQQVQEAMLHCRKLGADMVLHFDDIDAQTSNDLYPTQLERDVLQALQLGDREESHAALRRFLHEASLISSSHFELQAIVFQLFTRLLTRMEKEEQLFRSIVSDPHTIQRVFQIEKPQEFEEWLYEKLLLPILQLQEHQELSRYSDITEKLVHMVEEGFGNDISLEICASRLNFHPNYVSRVFKREMGITFSEYVSNYRLEAAKKWLRETDMKVNEIADKLNYNSTASFIRYFRKETGQTPGAYRETH